VGKIPAPDARTCCHSRELGLTRGTVLARELEIMYSQENGPDPATASKFAEIAAELRTLVESRK
jgi:hypothetical protein